MLFKKAYVIPSFVFSVLAMLMPNPTLAACTGTTQKEINRCASNDLKSAEKDLNAFYAKLEKTNELVASQRAWIAYRDAECAYQAKAFEGGSMAPMVEASCLADLTNQRLKQLIKGQQN